MHILTIESEATFDIARAIQFYDDQRADLGQEFLEDLKNLLMRVGENPRQHPLYRRRTRKTHLHRFPFLVLYRFDQTHAYVIGVLDARQSPRKVAGRARQPFP